MSLNDLIKVQEQRGITTFSFQQIRCVFTERSEKTLKTDINRLTLSKRIQNVYKGFYVIIPTQYQLKGWDCFLLLPYTELHIREQ